MSSLRDYSLCFFTPLRYPRTKCSPFEALNAGDWNNNQTFSVQDLILAQNFAMANGAGVYSGINQSAFEFGQFSSILIAPGFQHDEFNFIDEFLARRALLGFYCF